MGDKKSESQTPGPAALPPATLRWECDPTTLDFESTAALEPMAGVVGQDEAIEALKFGLETGAPGQNVFVRGLTGTGRMTVLRSLLQEIRPSCPPVRDRCYVHNFGQPDQPRLISLPHGQADRFRRRIDQFADFIRDSLYTAFTSEGIVKRREAIDRVAQQQLDALMGPFNEALQEAGLAVVTFQAGPISQTAIFPLHEGQPVPPEQYDQLHAEGKVSDDQYTVTRKNKEHFEQQLSGIEQQVNEMRRQREEKLKDLHESAARYILREITRDIEAQFGGEDVHQFLTEVVDDVATHRLEALGNVGDFTDLYRVNVVLEHKDDIACPIVVENVSTMRNLLGSISYDLTPGEQPVATHLGIRAGSLLRADGGYLVLDARDLLTEPGAWKVVVRTLRTGRLEIVPGDMMFPWSGPALKPEPIRVNVKVVMLGDADIYYMLDQADPDFRDLFKVLADFDSTIPRDPKGINEYARILARIASEEGLRAYDRSAVAAFVEEGARIAARGGKLSARFGLLADIAREAAFVAEKAGHETVTADNVRQAVARREARADLPARRFRELVANGTIRIQTSERAVGQVNGLAVLQAGALVYGFPARITATIGAGSAGVINIERESSLSGAIHTKGFYILGGLLRHLLRADHPLTFSASIAFEQSYGGIDGDSASGAEMCCLLSALTNIPLRQDVAMTGAIDQHGNILPIGGVNEKIEGFFAACRDAGLTGTQGVIIPQANVGDLMLRHDVADAARQGNFHIWAVDRIEQALEVFTGTPTGQRGTDGNYPEGTLLRTAVDRAREYWKLAAQNPHAPRSADSQ